MSEETFPDVKEWPESADRHHNQPPLEDRVVIDFDDALRARGLDERIRAITLSADSSPETIASQEDAGKAADLVAMARTAKEQVEGVREIFNRPLLTAQRSLKARADGLVSPMEAAVSVVRSRLDRFAETVEEPVRGDYGAKVSARTEWQFEIVDFAKLPLAIRRHASVLEAIEKVVRSQVRGGAREIPGVKIWPATKAQVR